MPTLLQCPYSPRAQSHAPTSVSTLKTLSTASHTIGHSKILHPLVGTGSAALAAAVLYPGRSRTGGGDREGGGGGGAGGGGGWGGTGVESGRAEN